MEPITVFDGKILDGRNRYKACLSVGVVPVFRNLDVSRFPDPVVYVLSRNLHRRDLTPSQRAMIGNKARDWYDAEAKKRMSAGGKEAGRGRPQQGVETVPPPIDAGKARDQAGKAVGVSGKTMDKARDWYDAEAKKRQAEQARRNQPQSQKVEPLPPLDKVKSRDQAGKAVGVCGVLEALRGYFEGRTHTEGRTEGRSASSGRLAQRSDMRK
jgi:hypothetical protein